MGWGEIGSRKYRHILQGILLQSGAKSRAMAAERCEVKRRLQFFKKTGNVREEKVLEQ